jgi:hypothetical protein
MVSVRHLPARITDDNSFQQLVLRQTWSLTKAEYRNVLRFVPMFSSDIAHQAENTCCTSSTSLFRSSISCMKHYTDKEMINRNEGRGKRKKRT